MSHKIQTSNISCIVLEIKSYQDIPQLHIFKQTNTNISTDVSLEFSPAQTVQINDIIQSIDPGNYLIKEYGKIQKGNKIFKIFISTFRGVTSLQIRERVISPWYAGFWKQWISLPTYKIKELQMHMTIMLQEMEKKKI